MVEWAEPDHSICSNCSTLLSLSGGAVNEIHIYTSTNEFEKSVTILDALWEIFGLSNSNQLYGEDQSYCLKQVYECGSTVLMCARCAEVVSLLYKDLLNLSQLTSQTSFVSKLLSHLEYWSRRNVPEYQYLASEVQVSSYSNETETFLEEGDQEYVPSGDSDYEEKPRRGRKKGSKKGKGVGLSKTSKAITKIKIPKRTSAASSSIQKKYAKNRRGGCMNRHFFKCTKCPKGFVLNYELFEHSMLIHDAKERSVCTGCGFQFFPEIFNMEKHQCVVFVKKTGSDGMPIHTCKICGEEFPLERLLKYHLDSAHVRENIKYECVLCHRNLIRRATLLQHYNDKHFQEKDAIEFQCNYCGMRFIEDKLLQNHIGTAHANELIETPEVCNECGKRFTTKPYLASHMRNVHGYRARQIDSSNFSCDICGKTFSQPKRVTAHKKFKHGSDEGKKHQCNICAKKFWTRGKLEMHAGIHTYGVRANTKTPNESDAYNLTYKCNFCALTFNYIAHVDMHTRTFHQKEVKYVCEVCKESFTTNIRFLIHKRKHMTHQEKKINTWNTKVENGELDCELCGKSYNTLRHLFTHHKYVHTEQKRTQCEICLKPLGSRTLLKHYSKFHPEKYAEEMKTIEEKKAVEFVNKETEPQEYLCDICNNGYLYSSKWALTSHKLMHTGEHLKHKCEICDKYFRTNSHLKRHQKSHEPKTPTPKSTVNKNTKVIITELPPNTKLAQKATKVRCTLCPAPGKAFNTKKGLTMHKLRSHYGNETVTCEICGHLENSVPKMVLHQRNEHPTEPRDEFTDSEPLKITSDDPCFILVKDEPPSSPNSSTIVPSATKGVKFILVQKRKIGSAGPSSTSEAEKSGPKFVRMKTEKSDSETENQNVEGEKRLCVQLERIDDEGMEFEVEDVEDEDEEQDEENEQQENDEDDQEEEEEGVDEEIEEEDEIGDEEMVLG